MCEHSTHSAPRRVSDVPRAAHPPRIQPAAGSEGSRGRGPRVFPGSDSSLVIVDRRRDGDRFDQEAQARERARRRGHVLGRQAGRRGLSGSGHLQLRAGPRRDFGPTGRFARRPAVRPRPAPAEHGARQQRHHPRPS